MEIKHSICFNSLDQVEDKLLQLGIKAKIGKLPGGNAYLLDFDISESDTAWPEIAKIVKEKDAFDAWDTFFSEEEIRQAEWSRLYPVYDDGFAQPEKDSGWKESVYDKVCSECSKGFQQISPFHIKREPRLGKISFMTLTSVYSLFATPKVFQSLKQHDIRGYEEWPVILHKTNTPSQVISQVYVPTLSRLGLSPENQEKPQTCPVCKITKYAFHNHGRMKILRSALDPNVDIQMTNEWFGDGEWGGFHEFLISKKLANLILDEKWKGVRIKPIELV
jgi:hypothetical protein